MVLSAINRSIKGWTGEHFPGLRGMLSEMYCLALSGFTGCAYVGALVCTRIFLCVFRVYGVRMWVGILYSIFRVFGKSTLLRFPGLRGALKGIFWDLECLSGGKFWYFDVGLGGLTYLLFVVSR
jgi:hypothetical protein